MTRPNPLALTLVQRANGQTNFVNVPQLLQYASNRVLPVAVLGLP